VKFSGLVAHAMRWNPDRCPVAVIILRKMPASFLSISHGIDSEIRPGHPRLRQGCDEMPRALIVSMRGK